jgi:hypothetical protein
VHVVVGLARSARSEQEAPDRTPPGELIALTAVPRTATGCRTTPAEFFEEETGALFAFFASRSRAGGAAWAARTYREFVQAGVVHSRAVAHVPEPAERLALWRRGPARGAASAADPAVPHAAVVFDCDGLLVNTQGARDRAQ